MAPLSVNEVLVNCAGQEQIYRCRARRVGNARRARGAPVITTPHTQLRTQALVVLVGVVALGAVVFGAVRALDSAGWVGVPLLVMAIVGSTILFLIPVEWLPATAVVMFAVIPDKLTPSNGTFGTIPLVTFVIVIWVVRRLLLQQGTTAAVSGGRRISGARAFALLAATFFLIWLIVTTIGSQAVSTSTTWTICFVASAMLVMLVPSAATEARLLREAWIRVGFWFGVYAAIEVALGSSPLYGPLYRAVGAESVQHWSVYRAEVGFGHPIWAGAFFAPAAILGLVYWLQTGRLKYLIFGAGAAVGVVSTVTRGSIGAIGIAIGAAVVIVALFTTRRSLWRIFGSIVGTAMAAVAVLVVSPLAERAQSVEGTLSTGARDLGTTVALKAAADSAFLGAGPGTSGISGRRYSDIVIESSILQLLISVGIPGVILFFGIVTALVINALRVQDVAAAAALVAFVIAISSFNSLDAIRSQHLLLGLLFLICLFPSTPLPRPPRPSPHRSDHFDVRPRTSPLLAAARSTALVSATPSAYSPSSFSPSAKT